MCTYESIVSRCVGSLQRGKDGSMVLVQAASPVGGLCSGLGGLFRRLGTGSFVGDLPFMVASQDSSLFSSQGRRAGVRVQ